MVVNQHKCWASLNLILTKKRLTQLITWDHQIISFCQNTKRIIIETLARQHKYKSSQVNILLLYNVGWCDVVHFPWSQLSGAGHVTSRSRQPVSALPGPGVKKEIFKSKFDMIWTLISLMFESQVGKKDVEWSWYHGIIILF